jgi:hypothetical protein
MFRSMFRAASLATALFAVACSVQTKAPASSTKPTTASAKARPQSKPNTSDLRSKARTGKPPEGAKSMGRQTPRAGRLELPVGEVEVYTFSYDVFGDGTPDETYFARLDDGTTYLWSVGPTDCGDGTVDPDGAFVLAVQPDGSGSYLFSLPACANSDLFGCDFDATGTETTCGACAFEETVIACVTVQ